MFRLQEYSKKCMNVFLHTISNWNFYTYTNGTNASVYFLELIRRDEFYFFVDENWYSYSREQAV